MTHCKLWGINEFTLTQIHTIEGQDTNECMNALKEVQVYVVVYSYILELMY